MDANIMQKLDTSDKAWVASEIRLYAGTPVEVIDVIVGHLRLSYLYELHAKDICADFKFEKELKSSPITFFSPYNELNCISRDIEWLAQDVLEIENLSTLAPIVTVRDYVTFLAKCRLADSTGNYKDYIADHMLNKIYYAGNFERFVDAIFSFNSVAKRYRKKRFKNKDNYGLINIVKDFAE